MSKPAEKTVLIEGSWQNHISDIITHDHSIWEWRCTNGGQHVMYFYYKSKKNLIKQLG